MPASNSPARPQQQPEAERPSAPTARARFLASRARLSLLDKAVLLVGLVALLLILWTLLYQSATGSFQDTSDWHSLIGGWLSLFALLLALLVIPHLLIALHECGHLLACRLVGFWFVSCHIGLLRVTRASGGLRWDRSGHFLSGSVTCYPRHERFICWKQMLLSAGGPLVSLLIAIPVWREQIHVWAVCTLTAHTLGCMMFGNANPSLADLFLNPALIVTTGTSTLICLLALIPHGRGLYGNDGRKILTALRGGPATEAHLLLRAIQGYALRGTRTLEWSADLIARAVVLATYTPYEHLICLYAYGWALATGNLSAGLLLDRALATCPTPAAPPALAFEAAFFEARQRANTAKARAWLEQGRGKGSEFEDILGARAEAAILLAEGQFQQAQTQANAGLEAHKARRAGKSLTWLREEAEQLYQLAVEAQARLATQTAAEGAAPTSSSSEAPHAPSA
jgi:hypothetical protein